MYLKSLTALGFKSFADKISMDFQPGITSIVGPNGCGKSNVADAIRWVLGEQSAKALRGSGMQDVIFAGTDKRKPLGMAEVSLTLGGVDKDQLKAAGVDIPYDEVTVTRRVFRDGGSDYFINNVSCRLKDIQQLFMGTGVGRTSYSIMAQGNITQILSSKPEERRLVFEEAAGITKFKAQKKEALRKLDHTEQNLLRVADLIKEVKRQIGSLQRQAGKARRYKKIISELEHLETQLARHQFDEIQSKIYDRSQELTRVREDIERSSANVLQGENEIGQLREALTALEHEISQLQHRGLELKGEIDQQEGRINFNKERIEELETQNRRALNDISEAEERRLNAENELASVNERLEASTLEVESKRGRVEERRASVQQVESELSSQQGALRDAQAKGFSMSQELNKVRNQLNALDLQQQGNIVREEKLSSEKIQLEEERTRLEEKLKEFSDAVAAEKESAAGHRGTVEERQARLKVLQQELSEATQQLDQLTRRQAEIKSRLNVLEQLQDSNEGFSQGAQAALKKSDAVLGSLAQKIRVPDEFVKPVETVLGQRLQLVLAQNSDAAQSILADLTANQLGRASIVALELLGGETSPAPAADASVFTNAGLPAPVAALSVIESDDATRPLLQSALASTWIVNDLAEATAAWKVRPGEFEFVTRDGNLLDRYGIYTGGAGKGKGGSSILARKNQIEELRTQLSGVVTEVDEASRKKGNLQSEQTGLQASLQEAQSELRRQEVQIATREGEFKALENSLRVLHQKIDTVVYEIKRLSEQDTEAKQKRENLAVRVKELEVQDENLQGELETMNAEIESVRSRRDEAHAELSEAKVELATEEQLCNSVRGQKGPLERRIQELTQLVTQRRNDTEAFLQRRAQAETEIETSRGQIETLRHDREQLNAQLESMEEDKTSREGDIAGREVALRDSRALLAKSQERRGVLDVELAEKRMSLQNLVERIEQKYHVNLEEVRSECITITIAEEGGNTIETLTPEEMQAKGLSTDWDAIARQVKELQERIDKIGPVNLVAIEEYEETEQRYEFLSQQHEDLVQAKDQLVEVIDKINTQTKQMFVETFDKIRKNFQEMFTEIFNGGKADLILVDEGNVLESGIDIVARPPGKKLQGITLLSGGEQTMTAVSLLFAIYQVKPSPFCVLDELDAPLDESNINRFIRILKRFLDHSQFVIITHNKRTIGIADVLYGVTMQEQGVSRIVSVKFHKQSEQLRDAPERPLVPPAADSDDPAKKEEAAKEGESETAEKAAEEPALAGS